MIVSMVADLVNPNVLYESLRVNSSPLGQALLLTHQLLQAPFSLEHAYVALGNTVSLAELIHGAFRGRNTHGLELLGGHRKSLLALTLLDLDSLLLLQGNGMIEGARQLSLCLSKVLVISRCIRSRTWVGYFLCRIWKIVQRMS